MLPLLFVVIVVIGIALGLARLKSTSKETGPTSVIAAIELDDKSHRSAARQKSDDIKNRVLAAAGIPLHRMPAKEAYTLQDVRSALDPILPAATRVAAQDTATEKGPLAARTAVTHQERRACPKCGSDLVERVTKRGSRQGTTFLGCSGHPRCRYAVTESAS